ncbi:DEAD/DEAH box helicase [Undibacterium curvum]|uniref:DEAD/DEAH box helicase n=1 Tax=Undibacterium curvum TaxID=2762294 RepID=UPI003D0970E9
MSILGGMPYPKQMQLLSRNPEILVATPGRLIDHMESGKIDFSQLQMLVLDEADRMLDMGFIDDIEKIVAATATRPSNHAVLATLDGMVGNMAQRITSDADERIQIARLCHAKHENIDAASAFRRRSVLTKSTSCWITCCATASWIRPLCSPATPSVMPTASPTA